MQTAITASPSGPAAKAPAAARTPQATASAVPFTLDAPPAAPQVPSSRLSRGSEGAPAEASPATPGEATADEAVPIVVTATGKPAPAPGVAPGAGSPGSVKAETAGPEGAAPTPRVDELAPAGVRAADGAGDPAASPPPASEAASRNAPLAASAAPLEARGSAFPARSGVSGAALRAARPDPDRTVEAPAAATTRAASPDGDRPPAPDASGPEDVELARAPAPGRSDETPPGQSEEILHGQPDETPRGRSDETPPGAVVAAPPDPRAALAAAAQAEPIPGRPGDASPPTRGAEAEALPERVSSERAEGVRPQAAPPPIPVKAQGESLVPMALDDPAPHGPEGEGPTVEGDLAAPADRAAPGRGEGPRAALAPHAPSLSSHVARQLAEAAPSRPGTVELNLDPSELGRVRITLSSVDGALAAVIVADRPETVDLMRRHADALEAALREAGGREVSVDVSGGGGPGSRRDGAPAPTVGPEALATPAPAPVARPAGAGGRGLDLRL